MQLNSSETRVALQESQGALTTLQRELIEVCKRGSEEEENKGKGIPKVANLKREMKECGTALRCSGQYLFLHKILAKERRSSDAIARTVAKRRLLVTLEKTYLVGT